MSFIIPIKLTNTWFHIASNDSWPKSVNLCWQLDYMSLTSEIMSLSWVMHMQKYIFLTQNCQLLWTHRHIHALLGNCNHNAFSKASYKISISECGGWRYTSPYLTISMSHLGYVRRDRCPLRHAEERLHELHLNCENGALYAVRAHSTFFLC